MPTLKFGTVYSTRLCLYKRLPSLFCRGEASTSKVVYLTEERICAARVAVRAYVDVINGMPPPRIRSSGLYPLGTSFILGD